jgi:sugar diacid utilization regulator
MTDHARSARIHAKDPRADAIHVIARRLATQREQLARRFVERARQEIVDYRTPSDPQLPADTLAAALENIDALVVSLQSGEPVPEDYLEHAREIAARRVHAGVPLESFLHAARLWATVSWEAVLSIARSDTEEGREAALAIAGRIMEFADRLSTAFSHAYLDEITDRGLLRRDLLDALLTAKGSDEHAMNLARRLHLRLEENYVVVVVRGEGVEVEEAREQSPAAHSRLDRIVDETRRSLQPSAGSALTGMRNGDLIVMYPVSSASDLVAVRQDCERLAATLDDEVSIGISGWHEGRESVGISYAEAREAVAIAARLGIKQRAVGLDEVLVDHMLRSSARAREILEDVLRPLQAYDASRHAALVPTLRAYLDARFNLTKAAEALFVNPNTVVYRLRRIKELSGRDTHELDDLMVLYLSLKLEDLRA